MAKILDMDKKYQIILIILVLCFLIIVFGTISASILSKFKLGEEDVAYVNKFMKEAATALFLLNLTNKVSAYYKYVLERLNRIEINEE